jgi:glycolate oxidase FAD binding subunit
LSGIAEYLPEEMTITVRPGTRLDEVADVMRQRSQCFAFDPPDLSRVLGQSQQPASVGGVVAANLSGSRRRAAGAARDHVLGIRAVNGRGEAFMAGGKVVKNVTGYDLCKVLTGSWGTLAVATEITLRVVPAPETECTLVVGNLSDATAVKAMTSSLGSPFEIAAAAHVPEGLAETSGRPATLIRLEGFTPSVKYRADELGKLLASFGAADEIAVERSRSLWADIRDVAPLAAPPDRSLWRLSVPPADGAAVAARIAAALDARYFFDWGGGLIWVTVPGDVADAGAGIIRAAAAPGHAMLIRASAALRGSVAVFQPLPAPLRDLQARIKFAFDPQGTLNPGRMY